MINNILLTKLIYISYIEIFHEDEVQGSYIEYIYSAKLPHSHITSDLLYVTRSLYLTQDMHIRSVEDLNADSFQYRPILYCMFSIQTYYIAYVQHIFINIQAYHTACSVHRPIILHVFNILLYRPIIQHVQYRPFISHIFTK